MISTKPLFILEIANNHMGDINHGLKIIKEFNKVINHYRKDFDFAYKLQYRHLETFIHPEYKKRTDIKYVKRFSETAIHDKEYKRLKDEIKASGNYAICTPFDEISVDKVEEHDFDIIKIASCSNTDWPLLERISKTHKPIIISSAGTSIEDLDKVVSFFQHREKHFAVMHCVGEYPTSKENLQLNQLDYLKNRYTDIQIGFSTHEEPDNIDAVKIAIAKGIKIFERHIGIKTEKYDLNAYSSNTEQLGKWLTAAYETFRVCGVTNMRYISSEKEQNDLLGLKRGVFAKEKILKGDKISANNTFYAIPNTLGQVLANNISKYIEYIVLKDIEQNEAVMFSDVEFYDKRQKVSEILNTLKNILIESRIYLPNRMDLELSHHYGIDRYNEFGAAIISCINREYCKKIIILQPNQKHPVHYHMKKEETFHVLYGDMLLNIDGIEKEYKAGSLIVVERKVKHSFSSKTGCIVEEVSTTHFKDDSYYDDIEIMNNKNRKTELTFWADWLIKQV